MRPREILIYGDHPHLPNELVVGKGVRGTRPNNGGGLTEQTSAPVTRSKGMSLTHSKGGL